MPTLQSSPLTSAIVIALSLMVSTGIGAYTFYQSKVLNNTIAVTGTAEKFVVSDSAKWTAHIVRSASVGTLKDDSLMLTKDTKNAILSLKESGISESEIQMKPLIMTPVCEGNQPNYDMNSCGGNRLVGYTLTQPLEINTKNVSTVSAASTSMSGAMLAQDILFTTDSVEYFYSKLADLKLELLSDATKNALTRADYIMTASGRSRGALRSVDTGVFQITNPNSTDVSDYGAYDTSSIGKKITAVIHATLSVK